MPKHAYKHKLVNCGFKIILKNDDLFGASNERLKHKKCKQMTWYVSLRCERAVPSSSLGGILKTGSQELIQ